jgi:hypothetical protein
MKNEESRKGQCLANGEEITSISMIALHILDRLFEIGFIYGDETMHNS